MSAHTRPDPRFKITPARLEATAHNAGKTIEVDAAANTMHLVGTPFWAELGAVAA